MSAATEGIKKKLAAGAADPYIPLTGTPHDSEEAHAAQQHHA